MKIKNSIIILFPSIIMTLINVFSFSTDRISGYDKEGMIILTLIIINPLLFFIQGIMAGKEKINMFLALGTSTAIFVLWCLIYLNPSALPYCVVYIIIGGLTYLFGRWFYRGKKA
ncbi:hypothetical protein [Clostridium folliculivorans]|uniref:Uncharacterized protein n=1 Tax=Clostridium folliculivorans TaxID=2886038 RepID=A0A9W6D980_9CLOT|nr:hypothetical protein [Clostridium folliculivorans]GKU24030.1 hypothetical protein CFOLD11_08560 [Clostridium folliculivorans]GKU30145.1 hypothetical protein CFB3_22520 [Clostridium folliculivorans]